MPVPFNFLGKTSEEVSALVDQLAEILPDQKAALNTHRQTLIDYVVNGTEPPADHAIFQVPRVQPAVTVRATSGAHNREGIPTVDPCWYSIISLTLNFAIILFGKVGFTRPPAAVEPADIDDAVSDVSEAIEENLPNEEERNRFFIGLQKEMAVVRGRTNASKVRRAAAAVAMVGGLIKVTGAQFLIKKLFSKLSFFDCAVFSIQLLGQAAFWFGSAGASAMGKLVLIVGDLLALVNGVVGIADNCPPGKSGTRKDLNVAMPNADPKKKHPAWMYTTAMTSLGTHLYIVQKERLWRTNPYTGAYENLSYQNGKNVFWTKTTAMAGLGQNLYIMDNAQLKKTDPQTGTFEDLGGYSWPNTRAIAMLNDKLYIIQEGKLWKVEPRDGAYTQLNTDDWSEATAMTAFDNQIFITAGGFLYRGQTDGVFARCGNKKAWTDTKALSYSGGSLYGLQHDKLWKANVIDGSYVQYGSDSWPNSVCMTERGDRLFAVSNDRLWSIHPDVTG